METDKQTTLQDISAEDRAKFCKPCKNLIKKNSACTAVKDPEKQNEHVANQHCPWRRRGGLFY